MNLPSEYFLFSRLHDKLYETSDVLNSHQPVIIKICLELAEVPSAAIDK
jgi:hypothetical protein